jgi:AcrR family transcriptional regulator
VGDRNVQEKSAAQASVPKVPDAVVDAGSTQRRNRERRIAEILVAATEVFREDGYAGFTTRRVAAKAGLTLSNLQYYFPNKEELLSVIIKNFLQGFLDNYLSIANQNGVTAQRRCGALVEQVFQEVGQPDTGKLLFETWAFAQHESHVSALLEDAYTSYRDIFVRLLSEINPALSVEECHARALTMTAQAEGVVIIAARTDNSDKDYEECARTAKRCARLIAGLSPRALEAKPLADGVMAEISRLQRGSEQISESRRVAMFGREGQIRRGKYDGAGRHSGAESSYLRPTMQSRKREAKIGEIIDEAANLLATEGYGNFTLARVAKRVGILASGLQHYFPTHDDLLRCTIDALFSVYYERWSEMSQPSGRTAIERLSEILDDVLVEACDPSVSRFSFEMFALAEHSLATREMLNKVYGEYRQIFVNLVREIDPAASGRECLARATLITAQLEGVIVCITYSSGRQAFNLDVVLRLIKSIALDIALGSRPLLQPTA